MAPTVATFYARYQSYDLVVDSRRVARAEATLFFALPGQRSDGRDFIGPLYATGVRHFVVQKGARPQVPKKDEEAKGDTAWTSLFPKAEFISVDNPLTLLQELAAHHRKQFDIPVVAITGSNGKTIVKDWLAQLLGSRYHVCASPRSYNSQIGVPLSVWRLRPEHQLAIFEAGISENGEMDRLAKIIQPTAGVFTMLGSAHDAGFPDRETKLREKLSLFRTAEWVAVCADDTDAVRELRQNRIEVRTFLGINARILEVEEHPLRLPFPDLPFIYLENAYTAAAAAYLLGLSEAQLKSELPKLQPLTNRLEQREGRHGGVIINDSYSNDLSALAAALEFAVAQNPFASLTLILGELAFVAQQDRLPDAEVRQQTETLQKLLVEHAVDRLIVVGRPISGIKAHAHFAIPEDLLTTLSSPSDETNALGFGEETTLVKGASYQRLDRIADVLSRKQHQTVLRLNLTSLRHNLGVYRSKTTAKVIAMVKASAYGGGALPVARAIAAAGADYLAVAYPDEGVMLREGGIDLPIMVLNAGPESYARCQANQLEPVVHNVSGLRRARATGLRVHLEVDTGMARLGFPADKIDSLLAELNTLRVTPEPSPLSLGEGSGERENGVTGNYESRKYAGIIATIFTHLVAADDEAQDDFTRTQLDNFTVAYDAICKTLGDRPARHALNTNGISRFPEYAFDYVRIGIGLYGIGDATLKDQLKTVLHLQTTVTRVYDQPAGKSVGYGRRGQLARDSRIAVLPIGYADGLPRLAGEGRFSVRIGNQLAPIVGSVCMDMTMVDVTDLPLVKAGTEVSVFGPDHSIDLLAAAAQTIPYEVLTGIGGRVHRVYLED